MRRKPYGARNFYRAMKELPGERDEKSIEDIVGTMKECKKDTTSRRYMPPLAAQTDTSAALYKLSAGAERFSHAKALQQSTPTKTETNS